MRLKGVDKLTSRWVDELAEDLGEASVYNGLNYDYPF